MMYKSVMYLITFIPLFKSMEMTYMLAIRQVGNIYIWRSSLSELLLWMK